MAILRIPCPNCRKELKVKDPALLGKKAKCPACNHRFVLEWMAEEEDVPVEQPDTAEFVLPEIRKQAGSQPVFEIPPAEEPAPTINVAPEGGIGRLNELRRRNRKRRNTTLLAGGLFVALLIGGYFIVRPYLLAATRATSNAVETNSANPPPPADVEIPAVVPEPSNWAEQLSPTKGQPIELRMVPSGVRLIVNLRPAQLWSNDARMAELRASLTQDVTTWLESQLRTICRHEPSQIEEVLLAWILGARGTEPQLTAVVHLVEEDRMSSLLDEFGPEVLDELARSKVYVKGDHATLILDPKTFAIAPREYGSELSDWVDESNYNTSDGILDLLPHTDRERLVTVVFEPADLQRHLEMLVSEPVRPVMSRAADWFAAQAETVSWSLHTGETFHSEILLRGPRTSSAMTVERNFKEQMEQLPHTMVDAVHRMRPQRSGFRKLIGRFPAMLEVSRLATISSFEGKVVRLLTVMPPKAAPNLALGTVLTWDESTRTDFSTAPSTAIAAAGPRLPDTLTERLNLPVDAEFNRVPLEEALDFIAREIHVTVEVDGDALKDAGFTKNMAQTFKLGKVPAGEALAHIVGQYNEPGKQMVVVLDEPRMTFLVLTKKFAEQRGLTVHDFGR